MATFKYEVRDSSGVINTGMLEAGSMNEAAGIIRAQGDYLLNVTLISNQAGNLLARIRSISIDFGPGLKDIQNFTNQLAVMIKAGINIRSAIDGIAEQVENPKFKKVIQRLKIDVESGLPFSEALARHPKVFTPLYVNMVRASELSGNFGQMLERIADYLGQQVETRNMVRGAMVYPAIIAVMAVVTTVFLLAFVLPKFTIMFAGKEALLPAPTKILIAMSNFLRQRWYVVIGMAGGGVFAFFRVIHTSWGRVYWDHFKLKMPLFKRMFSALYITRGLHTMGELISAGVPMLETLKITSDVSGNILYEKMWESVHEAVKQGDKIAHPLAHQHLLPRNVVQMVTAGEESGKLGEVLGDVAEFYSKELRSTIKTVTAMIEPLMIVVMGGIVGFIAMSMILPIFKMSSLVK